MLIVSIKITNKHRFSGDLHEHLLHFTAYLNPIKHPSYLEENEQEMDRTQKKLLHNSGGSGTGQTQNSEYICYSKNNYNNTGNNFTFYFSL